MNPYILILAVIAVYGYFSNRKRLYGAYIKLARNPATESIKAQGYDLNGSARLFMEVDKSTPSTVKETTGSNGVHYQLIFTKLPDNRVKFSAVQDGVEIRAVEADYDYLYSTLKEYK